MTEQFDDALPFQSIVLHHEQSLGSWGHESLHAIEGALQVLRRRGLYQIGKGPMREAVPLFLLDCDDLDRNMARFGREFELVEHGPAEHVGQENIQCDYRGSILAGQSDIASRPRVATRPLKPLSRAMPRSTRA